MRRPRLFVHSKPLTTLLAAAALCLSSQAWAAITFQTNYADASHALQPWTYVMCGADLAHCPIGCSESEARSDGYRCAARNTSLAGSACPAGDGLCRLSIENQAFDGVSRPYLKDVVFNGDSYASGSRTELVGPRLCENGATCDAAQGQDQYYSFNVYVPTSFPTVVPPDPTWVFFWQLHTNRDNFCTGTNKNPASFMFDDVKNPQTGKEEWRLVFTAHDAGTLTLPSFYWDEGVEVRRGHLYQFVLHVRWSKNSDGLWELWLDGQKVFSKAGRTLQTWAGESCMPTGEGAASGDAISWHFKIGNYHDDDSYDGDHSAMNGVTLYHSDLRISSTCEESNVPSCGSGTCVPKKTCASEGLSCGTLTDDCGKTVDCGVCPTPDTAIVAPLVPSSTTDTTPTFHFSATVAGASFECRIDSGAWQACASSFTTSALSYAAHTLSVRATANGKTDSSPASQTFEVATPPKPDAGTPAPDAGASPPDAGQPPADTGTDPSPDVGYPAIPGPGDPGYGLTSGCSSGAVGTTPAAIGFAALALVFWRSRRRR